MKKQNTQESNSKITVNLPAEIAEGQYANLTTLVHSNSEFVVDFIRLLPGIRILNVKARIIITPEHAKRLLAALTDNILKYEQAYGEISVNNSESNKLSSFDTDKPSVHTGG